MSAKPAVTMVSSRPVPKETMSPVPVVTLLCRVSSAVSPWRLTSMSMPLSSKVRWRSASERLASSTSDGTSLRNASTWLATGFASSRPRTTSTQSSPT